MRYPRSFAIGIAFAVTVPLAACSSTESVTGTTPPPAATSTKAAAGEKPAPATGKAAPARARTTGKPKTPAKPKAPAKPKPAATSDLSGVRITDIRSGKSILLDVADDDEDRFLQVGDNGKVGFTGTGRTDTTMMSLHAAPVAAANRVVIKPPFWNEDLGDGYCVADTRNGSLKLEICKPGKASQIWRVQLAGDSGLFELHGAYGMMNANNGRTALQVLPYAE